MLDLSSFNTQFPRSAGYDLDWVLENRMGPNVLWLTESLSQVLDLHPGMRVLDLGCGKAVSSIFLAKEFKVQVWAVDLWIEASENWQRIRQAGLDAQVFPIHAEAHSLPFADEFFDAVVSQDAYHYFGTDDLYLGWYLTRLVKPGGQIGIVVPGLTQELSAGIPHELKPFWPWDFASFHSPQWWRALWERSTKVEVLLADQVPDGWAHWLAWQEISKEKGYPSDDQETELLRLDGGKLLGFTRMLARRR